MYYPPDSQTKTNPLESPQEYTMYDISRPISNLNDMKLLSQQQKQIIRDEFYQRWKTCQNEMIQGEDLNKITSSRQPIMFALKQVMQITGIFNEIDCIYNKYFSQFLQELDLRCPTCNRKLAKNTKVGKYVGDDEFWHSINNIRELPKLSEKECSQISHGKNNAYSLDTPWGIDLKQDSTQEKLNRHISATQTKQKQKVKQDRIPQEEKDICEILTAKNNLLSPNLREQMEQNRANKCCQGDLQTTVTQPTLIACIDDNKTVQIQVKRTLELAGYEVLSIVDPGFCMTVLSRNQPKLILMDINMPYFDGYELCQMLKKSRQLKNIPIAFFSSKDTIVNRVRAKMCGAIGFLSKPIAPLELIDFVNTVVPITPESLLNMYVQKLKHDRGIEILDFEAK